MCLSGAVCPFRLGGGSLPIFCRINTYDEVKGRQSVRDAKPLMKQGRADLTAFGRQSISAHVLSTKARNGRLETLVPRFVPCSGLMLLAQSSGILQKASEALHRRVSEVFCSSSQIAV